MKQADAISSTAEEGSRRPSFGGSESEMEEKGNIEEGET